MVKANGVVADFDRERIARGVRKAAAGPRQLPEDEIQALVDEVERLCMAEADQGRIRTSQIGVAVERLLRDRDAVTHIRYSLVSLGRVDDERVGWRSASDFLRWLYQEYPDTAPYRPRTRLGEVAKRDGHREAFSLTKMEKSIGVAAKGRDSDEQVRRLASEVANEVYGTLQDQPLVTSGQIAAEILRQLRNRDHIAYLRFASSTKEYRSPEDFLTEADRLR